MGQEEWKLWYCLAPRGHGHSQDGGLDDRAEVRARRLQNLAHVGHHLLRLLRYVGTDG